MSGFDYKWTCPEINRSISSADSEISEALRILISKLRPDFSIDEVYAMAKTEADDLYERLEPCFENVRDENSKMRDAAEKQISDLEGEVAEKEEEISRLEKENSRIEGELESLKEELLAHEAA